MTGQTGLSREIAAAARGFVEALTDAERTRALVSFDGRHQRDWHYVPRTRPGLALGDMGGPVRERLWALIGTVLSEAGAARAADVVMLEGILAAMTGDPVLRDPANYHLLVMGDPAALRPFALRFEGHHLSLNVTVAPGEGVSVTPAFFGANPARVPEGHEHAGFRLFGPEEDEAFSLVRTLSPERLERVLIADRSLGDIVCGPGREGMLTRQEGLSVSLLPDGAREAVLDLAARFARTMAEPVASEAISRLREDAARGLHFAWAGSLVPGSPHYFRIHGERTLIEYDNTQNGANHVHTVFIDPADLFGADLLARHHRHGHG